MLIWPGMRAVRDSDLPPGHRIGHRASVQSFALATIHVAHTGPTSGRVGTLKGAHRACSMLAVAPVAEVIVGQHQTAIPGTLSNGHAACVADVSNLRAPGIRLVSDPKVYDAGTDPQMPQQGRDFGGANPRLRAVDLVAQLRSSVRVKPRRPCGLQEGLQRRDVREANRAAFIACSLAAGGALWPGGRGVLSLVAPEELRTEKMSPLGTTGMPDSRG